MPLTLSNTSYRWDLSDVDPLWLVGQFVRVWWCVQFARLPHPPTIQAPTIALAVYS